MMTRPGFNKSIAVVISTVALWLAVPTFQAAAIPPPPPKQDGNTKDGPKLKYVPSAELTSEQKKTVIALAAKRGIKQVTEISTYVLYPSPFRGITVKGVEQIQGREVTTQILRVQFKDWAPEQQKPGKNDIQVGDFWAGKPFTRKQTILKVAKKEYRTGTIQGLSIAETESILSRLVENKYTFGANVRQTSLDQIDWSQPQSFRKRGDVISVGFLHKGGTGSGFFELEIKPTDEALNIQQLFQAIP